MSKVKKQKDYWKQAYEWSLHGLDAVAFAKAILPFCSAKDDQLHLFINAYDDYASTKLPGTGQNKERQNKRNHLMMHSKLALEAMRSASAFNSCGAGKPSSCGGG